MYEICFVGSRTTKERNARGEGLTVYEISESTGNGRRSRASKWLRIQVISALIRRKNICTAYMVITHWYLLAK